MPLPIPIQSKDETIMQDIRDAIGLMRVEVAETKKDTGHILKHLETLNGRVGKAEERINTLERRESATSVLWAVLGAVGGALLVGLGRLIFRAVPIMLALSGAAWAQLATIDDTITSATGTAFQGRVTIRPLRLTYLGTSYTSNAPTVIDVGSSGALTVSLVPTVGASPPNQLYRVEYQTIRGASWTEYWEVPAPAASPFRLWQVIKTVVPSSPTVPHLQQIEGARGATGKVPCSDGTKFVLCDPSPGSDPTTNRGDIFVRGVSSASRLPLGTAGAVLRSDGTDPVWQIMPTTHATSFTSATTVTVTGSTHQLGTADLSVLVYSAGGAQVIPGAVSVNPSTFDVIVTFIEAQTGRVVLTKMQSAAVSFTGQTSVVITGATHGLLTTNLTPTCFDSSGAIFRPGSVTVNSSTRDVTFSFISAATGRCIVQGGQ